MNPIISLRNVVVGYEHNPILYDVNFDVYPQDFLGIVGLNGCRKNTLIKAMLGQIKPMKGTVSFYRNGKRVDKLNIGYLPQNNIIDKKFPISVYEVIRSGLQKNKLINKRLTSEESARIHEIVERIELTGFEKKAIGELSGGQLQRVLLGRAIVSQPEVIVLDEPNTYVDKHFERELYDIISEVNKSCAIIIASHKLEYIFAHAKNIIGVNNGQIFYHSNNEPNTQ